MPLVKSLQQNGEANIEINGKFVVPDELFALSLRTDFYGSKLGEGRPRANGFRFCQETQLCLSIVAGSK